MKMWLRNVFIFTAIVICIPAIVFGQSQSAPAATGFKGDLLKQVEDVEKKIVSLAEAVPAEKYSWRPGEGVRSVSEVLMHVAGANYLLPSMAGVTPPPGISRDMEKTVTEKPKVVEALKQSFIHLKQGIQNTPDADFEKNVKFFGDEATVRYVFLVAAAHGNEHLGQSIAYARMNGITPPWSAN
ncbi:MAG TPA: DinB family protein [Acidobacteriota bacterium]|nr:DinB family protein [Acidobacteriota bacterium]